ncbi:MAG: hypothetical protein DMF78_13295 [Acidobacteria bacterium]|nr:MAG: hypothetical protein DMF78_13295 [Acidobacteriota bacterium]
MEVQRRDLAVGIAVTLLLAVAIVRTAVPDRSRLRALSIQGLDIKPEPVAQGHEYSHDEIWEAPEEIYVMGWNYYIGAPGSGAELLLLGPNDERIFQAHATTSPQALPVGMMFFENGGAWKLGKHKQLRLRYRLWNTGPAGSSYGASALVYFVPAEGN